MTEKRTSLYKKCHICTGCGRCPWDRPDITAVTTAAGREHAFAPLPEFGEESVIAADIGTTTIVMQLRRLSDGRVLDTFQQVNPQRKYGADVLSRIQAAEEPEGKQELCRLVMEVLKEGIGRFRKQCMGEAADEMAGTAITGMTVAANTAMVHLLMGYDTSGLGRSPFTPEHLEETVTCIEEIPTVILPGISAFAGGDITAGLYATGFPESGEICLFIDLGTNGEMAVGNRRRILVTSAAAGPAFEGRNAVGIWGSDLVAMTAALLHKGLVDESGLLQDAYFEQGVRIGSVLLTRQDIRSLQMAKAAIYAGIRILCDRYGIEHMSRIRKVYLAGGFGFFLDTEAAIRIGLLPRELRGKIIAVGNTALEGAFCYAREKAAGEKGFAGMADGKMETLLRISEAVNLAMQEEFNDLYIGAMALEEL